MSADDCPHGQLRRVCRICELEGEVRHLRMTLSCLRLLHEQGALPQTEGALAIIDAALWGEP
jgi:hypothetical protein